MSKANLRHVVHLPVPVKPSSGMHVLGMTEAHMCTFPASTCLSSTLSFGLTRYFAALSLSFTVDVR